jgi:hypothetical protein
MMPLGQNQENQENQENWEPEGAAERADAAEGSAARWSFEPSETGDRKENNASIRDDRGREGE